VRRCGEHSVENAGRASDRHHLFLFSNHSISVYASQHSEISTEKYWRFNFKAVMGLKQLTRYIVLNVEPVLTAARPSAKMGKVRVGGGKAGSVSRGRG
jgi:hypothetical protein